MESSIENNSYNPSSKSTKNAGGSFQTLGLDKDVLKGVLAMGFKLPTPVQRKTLPLALSGMDIVCMARTGSGKTLAFLIPMIQRLLKHEQNVGVRGIILSPTRELAMQTLKVAKDVARYTNIRIISITGGDGIEAQYDSLADNPDVIVASPGRLSHHLNEISTFKLKSVQYIVFDEADRLFEMGFAEQINDILKQCPIERQTLLFSATMPKMLVQFSRAGLRDPQLVRLDTDVKMSEELRLAFFYVRTHEKLGALLYLVRQIIPSGQSTIIFTATRHHSEFIYELLHHIGLKCSIIYGSMDQESRQNNLKSFRMGEVNFLVVTDLAARGIDIPLINNVINYHFPPTPKLFVHRCGRAARQGRIGFAFSLVEPEELPYAVDVYRFLDFPINTGKKSLIKYSADDAKENDDDSEVSDGIDQSQDETPRESYTLDSMLPSQVHLGLLPQDVLDEEIDYIKCLLSDHETLSSTFKVSENAMKQYRRTRTAASHDGVKTTKKLMKGDMINTIHPLINGMDPSRCNQSIISKAQYVKLLQTFRPVHTVLETGIGTGSLPGVKKRKRGPSIDGKELANDSGVSVMKLLRQMNHSLLERNREKLSLYSDESGDLADQNAAEGDDEIIAHDDEILCEGSIMTSQDPAQRPRLSIAERRKLKKKGMSNAQIQEYAIQKMQMLTDMTMESKGSRNDTSEINKIEASKFRDPKYFMTYGTEDARASYAEESLQPKSGLRSNETQTANMLENAMLDLTSGNDELMENKKKKITHWDEKKRKFVKQTLVEMASSGRKGVKRLRSESGVSAPSKKKRGEMYEKWKKKSHREIGTFGESTMADPYDNKPRPNFKVNTHVKDEIKNRDLLKKASRIREKNKVKNMSKDKRASIQKRERNGSNSRELKMKERKNEVKKGRTSRKGRTSMNVRTSTKGREGKRNNKSQSFRER